nr:uncharacterized protein LOC105345898 [Crassostrea gigas]
MVDSNKSETSTQLEYHTVTSNYINDYPSIASNALPMTSSGPHAPTKTAIEYPRLFIEMRNNSLKELHVGMKAEGVLKAIYTEGNYDSIGLRIETECDCVDVDSLFCSGGSDIKSARNEPFKTVLNSKSGFFRIPKTEFLRHSVNISGLYTEDDRTDVCNVTLYFHNGESVMDGETITTIAYLTMLKGGEWTYLATNITFKAKTSTLAKNKTAMFDVNFSVPKFITAEKTVVTKINFTHWIPYYRPLLEVVIYGESETMFNFITSMYIRVVKVGDNFFPGVRYWDLIYACHFPDFENGTLTLKFPSHWVNRNYYYTEQTTANDRFELEAGITFSESAPAGVNYTFRIDTMIKSTRVWNSSVTMTTTDTSLSDMMSQFNISLHRPTLNELYPTSKATVLIQVTIPSLFSNPIYLNVSTFAVTEDNSLVIESVSIYSTSDGVLCTSVDEPFQMNNDSYQYRKYVIVDFVNTADTPEYLYLLVNLRVDQNTKFGKIHAVAAESNNRTVEYKVSLNSPMVLHDTEGIISSGLNKIVDGNYTSCIKLPRQGERPPWFWLTLSVLWLKIAPKPFQVTVVGDQISCKPHGQNLIQVTYPVKSANLGLNNKESKPFALCVFVYKDIQNVSRFVECTYECNCREDQECHEISLFMANQEKGTYWRLCELRAQNTF